MTIIYRLRPAPWLALAVALALGATACGGDGGSTTTSPPLGTTNTTADATSSSSTDPVTTSSSTTSSSTTLSSTSTSTPATTGLPGEPFDGFIRDGDVLAVVAVAHDDRLNLRAAPGTDQRVVHTAGSTEDDLVATGRQRLLPNSIWYEVRLEGSTGWVSSSFVAYQGGTDDFTSAYIAEFGRSQAPTMEKLGELIAANLASVDPPSRIANSVAASVGDLGEVAFDVIGLGDDSVAGFRLHIFAVDEGSSGVFAVTSIERTLFCLRGLSGEICV